jgi:DNA-binding transcriptional LysR family regulator
MDLLIERVVVVDDEDDIGSASRDGLELGNVIGDRAVAGEADHRPFGQRAFDAECARQGPPERAGTADISLAQLFHGIDAEGNVILRRQLKRRYVLAFFQKLPPCLPLVVADDLHAGTPVVLNPDQRTVEVDGIYAVFLPDRHPAAEVRAFLDFSATRFAPEPAWDRVVRDHAVA